MKRVALFTVAFAITFLVVAFAIAYRAKPLCNDICRVHECVIATLYIPAIGYPIIIRG